MTDTPAPPTDPESKEAISNNPPKPPITPRLICRGVMGGVLMGLANLVPGISGGTMLLAAGIYPRFIDAIAKVTTLRFSKEAIVVLTTVVGAALLAIVGLAGVVKGLVVDYRWVMYSLFIGLTLGGVPVIWRMVRPADSSMWCGAAVGFAAMGALAWVQQSNGNGASDGEAGFAMMLVAGVAGASAMILPGVSGGYLLLVLGVYVPILTGIDQFKEALKAADIAGAMEPTLGVVLPVGLGVVLGVVVVSNALKGLLAKYEKATLGTLLGLLVGAVVGLWPFQQGVAPVVGEVYKGRVMTTESIAEIDPSKFPTEFFGPTGMQIGGALALIGLGYALTSLVGMIGGRGESGAENPSTGSPSIR